MSNQTHLTRRDLIKGLALAGTMSATAGLLSGCDSKPAGSNVPEKWDYEADVVTLGAGAGGMVTSVWAAKEGASVILIEKAGSAFESCSSVCAGEYVAGGTSTHKEMGYGDTSGALRDYLIDNSPEGLQKPALIDAFLPSSVVIYEWLLELGCECAGCKKWPGMEYEHLHTLGSAKPTQVLVAECEKQDVNMMFDTPAKQLIQNEDGRVIGVEAEQNGAPIFIKAKKGVMLACGGYAASPEMLYNFNGPLAAKMRPAGSNNNTGDGFKMAWQLGAALEDVYIAPPPAVAFATAKGTAYGLYHVGGIIVNKEGKRFMNESGDHTEEANGIASQTDNIGYVIFDAPQLEDSIGKLVFDRHNNQGGTLYQADTLEELAELVGLPVDVLVETVNKYNSDVDAGQDSEFGRDHVLEAGIPGPLVKIETAPFYSLGVMGALFPSEMGLRIDTDSRVVDNYENVIEGLYATGLMANMGIKFPFEPRTLTAFSGTMTFGYIGAMHMVKQEAWDA